MRRHMASVRPAGNVTVISRIPASQCCTTTCRPIPLVIWQVVGQGITADGVADLVRVLAGSQGLAGELSRGVPGGLLDVHWFPSVFEKKFTKNRRGSRSKGAARLKGGSNHRLRMPKGGILADTGDGAASRLCPARLVAISCLSSNAPE